MEKQQSRGVFVVEETGTLRTLPEPGCEEGHGSPVGLQVSFRSGSFGPGPDDRF